jgi:hypothetical protein
MGGRIIVMGFTLAGGVSEIFPTDGLSFQWSDGSTRDGYKFCCIHSFIWCRNGYTM